MACSPIGIPERGRAARRTAAARRHAFGASGNNAARPYSPQTYFAWVTFDRNSKKNILIQKSLQFVIFDVWLVKSEKEHKLWPLKCKIRRFDRLIFLLKSLHVRESFLIKNKKGDMIFQLLETPYFSERYKEHFYRGF